MKEKLKNVFNVLLDIIIVLFMIFAVLVLVVALTQKTGNVSHIFGYTVRSVQTDSMEAYNEDSSPAEGAIFVGDLIICKISDETAYNVGDTVMFYMPVINTGDGYRECQDGETADQSILVTHNIVEVVQENGAEKYRTKGINNAIADFHLKTAEEIIAVYTGLRIAGVGTAIDFIQTSTGFFLCIILPILIFVIFQTIRVIRNFIAYKAQKLATETPSGELTEDQKRLIAEEYLKQQQAAEDDTTSSTVDTADGE